MVINNSLREVRYMEVINNICVSFTQCSRGPQVFQIVYRDQSEMANGNNITDTKRFYLT